MSWYLVPQFFKQILVILQFLGPMFHTLDMPKSEVEYCHSSLCQVATHKDTLSLPVGIREMIQRNNTVLICCGVGKEGMLSFSI